MLPTTISGIVIQELSVVFNKFSTVARANENTSLFVKIKLQSQVWMYHLTNDNSVQLEINFATVNPASKLLFEVHQSKEINSQRICWGTSKNATVLTSFS